MLEQHCRPGQSSMHEGLKCGRQNYAGHILLKCNQFDTACKLLARCWQKKARTLMVVEFACGLRHNRPRTALRARPTRAASPLHQERYS